jgi:hypothetical protein
VPRHSLILPTHNRADVVGFAIRSVLDQTDGDFELFVVGDGCTDATGAVVQSFDDTRVHWLDLPKAPHYGYANRNIALKQASGEFIAYIAHDDLLFPDHLARLSAQLDREHADWIFSRPLWVSMQGVVVPYSVTLLHDDERRSYMVEGNPIPMSCVMHRRRVIEYAGWWPDDVPSSADWVYWKSILANGGVLASHRQPTTLHFVADWRRAHGLGQPEAMTLLHLAETSPWWPETLRAKIAGGETEQAVFYRWMKGGGMRAADELRQAIDVVIDRLAWDRTCDLRTQASAKSVGQRIVNRVKRTLGA